MATFLQQSSSHNCNTCKNLWMEVWNWHWLSTPNWPNWWNWTVFVSQELESVEDVFKLVLMFRFKGARFSPCGRQHVSGRLQRRRLGAADVKVSSVFVAVVAAHWFFSCRMFMYIFLGGLVVLMLFGIYQVLESRTVWCVRCFFFSLDVAVSADTNKLCTAEEEAASESWKGHRWLERRGHQLDPSGDSERHEWVYWCSRRRNESSWTSSHCKHLLADKASPRASPRKRANRAAGADQ